MRAIDGALIVGAGLAGGALFVVAPAETALAVGAAALALIAAKRAAWVAILAVALAVGWARGERIVAHHEAERAAAAGAPARCTVRGEVAASPVESTGSYRWDVDVAKLECEGGAAPARRITLYGAGGEALARGDEIEATCDLSLVSRAWNEASGDPRPAAARRGVVRSGGALDVRTLRAGRGPLAWIDRARAHVRRRIEATFPDDTAPMARALVLGESDLADEDAAAFRTSGLAHLLAVSGMHLVLVVAGAAALLRALLARIEPLSARVDAGRVAAAIVIPLTWAYEDFAGGSGSAVRAAWMASAALAARALARRTPAARAFGISLVAMAAADPLAVFDLSFLLSAGATGGLLLFARPLGEALSSRVPEWLGGVARSTATTLAATLPCAPLLARIAPTLPIGGLFANLVAVPVGELAALPLCLAHALLEPIAPAERGCALLASGALAVVRGIARAASSASFLSLAVPPPTSWQLAALAAGGALSWAARGRARLSVAAASAAAFLLLEIGARRGGAPRGVLRATFLDVGQGDSALVDLPDGTAMLVDGGGAVGSNVDIGARVVAPALRARRRDAVALAVLTHPHPDHFGGLRSGLASVSVGAFWDTGEGEARSAHGEYAALLASMRARGAPVVRPAGFCGTHDLGGARIEVLAPCPGPDLDRAANDNSIVFRIAYGARAILFVGDTEREEESLLLGLGAARLRADVLKVGHHGSRTSSSPAFLAAVAPREAVISSGVRNRFHHPNPATLTALGAQGARVWRTDERGAIVVTTDGRSLDVEARSP